MNYLSKIFLLLDYLNPLDDPPDIVGFDDQISGLISIAIAILSITLATLAYKSYRRTGFSKLKYIIVAFSLFSLYLVVDAVQELLTVNDDSVDLILSVIILFILISFFLGIMNKKRKNVSSHFDV